MQRISASAVRVLSPVFVLWVAPLRADEKPAPATVLTGYSASGAGFNLDPVPPPATNDAATGAEFTLVEGDRDRNGADLAVLHDGKVPAGADEPAANFFFAGGTKAGRLALDLKSVLAVQSVATYSWHPGVRGPQVYKLYAADGTAQGFNAAPKSGTDPASCGWSLVATVDTRKKESSAGQHAAAIARDKEPLGRFRYLLFDIQPSSDTDVFGQTFFSEIDVVDAKGPELTRLKPAEAIRKTYPSPDGKYKFIIDTSNAPDLAEWAETKLVPVVHEWYPKMVAMLPGDNYTAPDEVLLQFKNDMRNGIPAYASGNQVSLNAPWFRRELEREARGCVVHELVHVVQNYWRANTGGRRARNPGWIVEGIPDYIRWFLYEPQAKGAEITARNFAQAKFDASYRISANFLDWVTKTYPKDIVRQLNAACREGKYSPDLWKEWTGKTLDELGADWKKAHADRLGIKPQEPPAEKQTPAEAAPARP